MSNHGISFISLRRYGRDSSSNNSLLFKSSSLNGPMLRNRFFILPEKSLHNSRSDPDFDFSPSDVESLKTDTNSDLKLKGLGGWEEMHGNYVLRPPASSNQHPRALIHFLGGAIVGAAPDISYRYLLERIAEKGFLVVATPYTLSFDYISTCDDIIGKFERIAPTLAKNLGPVPVVGVGHSCGALLQLLITTLFPDTPRAANTLISYNNRGVKEAVPLFEEVFVPLFENLAKNETNPLIEFLWSGGHESDKESGVVHVPPSSLELIKLSFDLSRTLVQGNLPSDEFLSNFIKRTTPKPLTSVVPRNVQIPPFIRESAQQLVEPLIEAQMEAGVTPILNQSLDVLWQLPSLIEEVSDGARDFNPPPDSIQAAVGRSYRARRTLIIEYDDDPIDQSVEIERLLRDAEIVMRNRRPMVDFDVRRTVLKGGHATPCIAPPLDLASRAEDILGNESARGTLLYNGAHDTAEEVIRWLEEGNF